VAHSCKNKQEFTLKQGETSWLPTDFDLTPQLPLNITPNGFSEAYVKNMEQFGPITEVHLHLTFYKINSMFG